MDENLRWLLKWFHSQCDGEWEARQVVTIATLDNPGWYLETLICETLAQAAPFQKITVDRSEHDWISCFVEDDMFKGYGGPFNFPEILQIFQDWTVGVEAGTLSSPESFRLSHIHSSSPGYQVNTMLIQDDFTWLVNWYYSQCNGDWEHCFSIAMHNFNGADWYFRVGIDETELADQPFTEVDIKRSRDDWLHCAIEKRMFQGRGGSFNLPEMIKIFRNWAEKSCQFKTQ